MSTSRRQLLQYSLAAASMLAVGVDAQAQSKSGAKSPVKKAKTPKKILILGGTGFLGPAIVAAAQARGHTLTLFNRGKTRPELFPNVEKLQGDRDPKKDEGLKALEGRKWDAVIDTSGYYPRMVKASAELLAPNVGQYVFISSISAYAKNDIVGQDESGATATLADPNVEEMGKNFENYGGLKRACEEAAEKAFPGRTANVRPGYIVGPEDRSDRFTWFPVRYERGGEMLAPGSPADPLQIIDVRDLAEWLVHVVENNITGVYNALGPEKPWSMGELFAACKKITGKDTKLTWVPSEFLVKQGEDGDGEIPIWAPPLGKYTGMHRYSNAKAVKAGLKFRSPATTTADTLAWFKSLPQERRDKMRAGLKPEREQELLKLWAEAQKGQGAAAPAAGNKTP
ncbi:SDR family oxidoreductase [Pyxidicoccus fallax]|uniref:UDP-glucose 4-epimerase n=1 Tax=Pyxidicoccus fallax TaxID=394095 RepID=A0A848LB07_9BACT|nr:SDR family oxidoreductase [Pyxidicoccus fallax]NMO15817.1 SDR family oxidoreductase [Pyxidicoccus fallax]NPC79398.1 SDR family oxidoreductase [Pyxidicoccus fallax]